MKGQWTGRGGISTLVTAPIRNTSGVSGCGGASVNEKWECSHTSFMDFTARRWGVKRLFTGVSPKFSSRLMVFQKHIHLSILNHGGNAETDSINCFV